MFMKLSTAYSELPLNPNPVDGILTIEATCFPETAISTKMHGVTCRIFVILIVTTADKIKSHTTVDIVLFIWILKEMID